MSPTTAPLFEQHLSRAEALEFFPAAVNGTAIAGEPQWRAALGDPRPAVRAAAIAALDGEEARRAAIDAGRTPATEPYDLAGEDPVGDQARAEMQRDHQERAAYRRSPEAQLDTLVEILGVLKEIRDQGKEGA